MNGASRSRPLSDFDPYGSDPRLGFNRVRLRGGEYPLRYGELPESCCIAKSIVRDRLPDLASSNLEDGISSSTRIVAGVQLCTWAALRSREQTRDRTVKKCTLVWTGS